MAPQVAFQLLVELMEEDNGCTFEVSPEQRTKGEELVAAMMAKGWDPTGVTPGLAEEYDYASDAEVLAQGEYSDTVKVAERWGGQELLTLLNQIFGEDE